MTTKKVCDRILILIRGVLMKKVIFMGTPDFACSILKTLLKLDYLQVVAVVSQPDKKVGRKQEVVATPVKVVALENNIRVIQPINIKTDYQQVIDVQADLVITCAYGQIVPQILLDAFEYGCINVHASLLPKHRGGAPIHMAIINGDSESGVTIMRMVKKMDAGNMLFVKKVAIDIEDCQVILHDKLMVVGSDAIIEFLPDFFEGNFIEQVQDESLVTIASNISKQMELINIENSYMSVYKHIKGLVGWPVGFMYFNNKKIKIHQVSISDEIVEGENGSILGLFNNSIKVIVDNRVMLFDLVQLEGKKVVSGKEFYNGLQKVQKELKLISYAK